MNGATLAPRPWELRPRILLVEDDRDAAWVTARALRADYDVTVAFDGLDGLALATGSPAPDLIITDVGMPRLDGLAMIHRVREIEARRKVPVIFLTSLRSARDVVHTGARCYMSKPFCLDQLEAAIRRLLQPFHASMGQTP